MDLAGLPPIPLDLLVALEQRYPEESAVPGDTLESLLFKGGKRDLIRWLRLAYASQQNPGEDEPDEEA